jgi:hypothetical protein
MAAPAALAGWWSLMGCFDELLRVLRNRLAAEDQTVGLDPVR